MFPEEDGDGMFLFNQTAARYYHNSEECSLYFKALGPIVRILEGLYSYKKWYLT
jgi:hypothetical protein